MTTPTVQANGEPFMFDGFRVGQRGTWLDSGEIVACFWKPLFRMENSYALSLGLFNQIEDDIDTFFIVDSESRDVYKFDRETYYDAKIIHFNQQRQLVPDRDLHDGYWKKGEEDIFVD